MIERKRTYGRRPEQGRGPRRRRTYGAGKNPPNSGDVGEAGAQVNSQKEYRADPKDRYSAPLLSRGTLRIIPIGGCEEVGRNMTVYEYGNDIVILDMGLQFPEEDMPGIDFIIPNVKYLRGKEKNIRGVIFSHGHLDHIGAAPILLKELGYPPIIGRDLTIALVKKRLEDYEAKSVKNLKIIRVNSVDDRLNLGQFRIGFFNVEHSIMDAMGVIINTPRETVIHPGDWTMEKNSQNHEAVSYGHLANLPQPKILMLESLGATDLRTSTTTEEEMYKNLE